MNQGKCFVCFVFVCFVEKCVGRRKDRRNFSFKIFSYNLKSNKRRQKQEEVQLQGEIQPQTSLGAVAGKYVEPSIKSPAFCVNRVTVLKWSFSENQQPKWLVMAPSTLQKKRSRRRSGTVCQPRLFLSTRGGGGACIGSMLPRLVGNLGASLFINASNKFNCVLIIDRSNLINSIHFSVPLTTT